MELVEFRCLRFLAVITDCKLNGIRSTAARLAADDAVPGREGKQRIRDSDGVSLTNVGALEEERVCDTSGKPST